LNEEIARAQRLGARCSVAIIDLDYFKRINDQFGHPVGDDVLRTFAITLSANLRAIDRLGRYGGEEFLLVMPDTARDDALRTVDRLRSIIAELDWTTVSGMNVTISGGISEVRQDDSAEDILGRADVALYRAKDSGRNQIIAA
jgi:diguanylate cyclase (GGDEF)-like protein